MKQINCTVIGVATDTPTLRVDNGVEVTGQFESATRVIFHLDDDVPPWGAAIRYAGTEIRVLVPISGAAEGPPLTYAPAATAIGVAGSSFTANGARWTWRGCADFRLPARAIAGEDLRPVLADRRAVGATLLRCFAMKVNNIGWELRPSAVVDYFGEVRAFFDTLGAAGFACEWTVFADTRALMPDAGAQLAFWYETIAVARDYPFVLLELVNEAGHPTQALDPQRFLRPTGVLASHGSGLTDAHPPDPWWDFATYHARRDRPPDARGFTNYNPYEFEARYPQPCPLIADEGLKPQDYRCDVACARLMGVLASCGAGGTFHSDEGIQSVVFSPETRACAAAFFEALA